MKNTFSFKGQWFLPSNTEEILYGTLTYDGAKGLLEIIGDFVPTRFRFEGGEQNRLDIIWGFTTDGKKVTLVDCMVHNRSNSIPGMATGSYRPKFIAIGWHFESLKDMQFNSVIVQYAYLDLWLNKSCFKIDTDLGQKYDILYTPVSPIEFKVNDKIKGSFIFVLSAPIPFGSILKTQVEQEVYLKVESIENKFSIDDFFNIIGQFRSFFTLALNHATQPTQVILLSNEILDEQNYPVDIKLYYSRRETEEDEKYEQRHMLFSYAVIEEKFEEIIQEWWKCGDSLNPSINLYLSGYYLPNLYLDNLFLNIAHAVESLHRRTMQNFVKPENEFAQMKNEILGSVPAQYFSWLEEKLQFSNEPNLHNRLDELISTNSLIAQKIIDKDQFIKDVKNTRNYLTHFSKHLEKKRLQGLELLKITEMMRLLFVCCLLQKLNFTPEQIEKISSNSNVWWFTLNKAIN